MLAAMPGMPELRAGAFDLASQGYVAAEFELSGTASSFRLSGGGADGRWSADSETSAGFVTRLVVFRPSNPDRFSGIVLAEWLNISSGGEVAAAWANLHREAIRAGHAYVGISCQLGGIEGGGGDLGIGNLPLRAADPDRYARLDHPGDAFSFDIFAQALAAIEREPGKLFGSSGYRYAIATGVSQSAWFLTSFFNVFAGSAACRGYLVHARFDGVAPLEAPDIYAPPANSGVGFRTDIDIPLLAILSETDVLDLGLPQGGYAHARQRPSDHVRIWEIAGSAHSDQAIFSVAEHDVDGLAPSRRRLVWRPRANILGRELAQPINAAPQQYFIAQAALRRLVEWIDHDIAPPLVPPIALAAPEPATARRDASGIAEGGVRSPWTDAPLMAHSALPSSPDIVARLAGQSRPLGREAIEALYPGGRADYLARFRAALDRAVAAGVLLEDNHAEIIDLGDAAWDWASRYAGAGEAS